MKPDTPDTPLVPEVIPPPDKRGLVGRGARRQGSPEMIVVRERRRQALQLRKAGASYEQIADQLGFANRAAARKAVVTELDRVVKEPAQEVLTMELQRLDQLLVGLWPRAIKGENGAVDRVLKIMERRAKYLGLDAAVKVDLRAVVLEMSAQYGLSPVETERLLADVNKDLGGVV